MSGMWLTLKDLKFKAIKVLLTGIQVAICSGALLLSVEARILGTEGCGEERGLNDSVSPSTLVG